MKKLVTFINFFLFSMCIFLNFSMDVSAADADYKYPNSRHYYIYGTKFRYEFDTDVILAFYESSSSVGRFFAAPIFDLNVDNPSGSTSYAKYRSFLGRNLQNVNITQLQSDGTWKYWGDSLPTYSFYLEYFDDKFLNNDVVTETNVPIFNTEQEAIDIINSGGQLPEEEANIYFKDFQSSGTDLLYCSWSDVYYNPLALGVPDLEQSYFSVEISSLTPGAGTDPAVFAEYGGNYNLFSVKEWYLPLSMISLEDNDITVFCATFTPHLVNQSGNSYVGSSFVVRFNKAGVIDIVRPSINRESVYDKDCNFVGMNYSDKSKDHSGVGDGDSFPVVNILWNSINHSYDVSSFTNPKITISSDAGKSVDLNNFVYGGNIDYKNGNGYFELNMLDCIDMLFDKPPSYSTKCIWYINITPTYTDGYNDYYGNPFVIKMENISALTGGIATPEDPFTPIDEVPPRDWVDPDPGTGDIDFTKFDFTYFTDLLTSLTHAIGGVPSFVGYCFSFLPNQIIAALAFLIIVCVILRILGR